MYQACRHIKPSGQRCQSPAMRDHSFCYFHARVHTRSKVIDPRELRFPVPEDFAAIQESIAKVLDGIVNESIGPKQSSQILRGLQIALQTIPRTPAPPTESARKSRSPKKATSSLHRLRSVLQRSKQGAVKKPCPLTRTSTPPGPLATCEDWRMSTPKFCVASSKDNCSSEERK